MCDLFDKNNCLEREKEKKSNLAHKTWNVSASLLRFSGLGKLILGKSWRTDRNVLEWGKSGETQTESTVDFIFLLGRAHESPVPQQQDPKAANGRISTCPDFTRESLLSFWLSKVDIRWQLPLLLLPSRLMCSAILYGFWESNVGGARPDFSIQRNSLVLVYYYLHEVMASLLQHGNCCRFLHSSWVLYMVLLEHICLLYQA